MPSCLSCLAVLPALCPAQHDAVHRQPLLSGQHLTLSWHPLQQGQQYSQRGQLTVIRMGLVNRGKPPACGRSTLPQQQVPAAGLAAAGWRRGAHQWVVLQPARDRPLRLPPLLWRLLLLLLYWLLWLLSQAGSHLLLPRLWLLLLLLLLLLSLLLRRGLWFWLAGCQESGPSMLLLAGRAAQKCPACAPQPASRWTAGGDAGRKKYM